MRILNDTEQKIVDAAATVFVEKGKAGARTQMIADLAGINKALLHYYFRSKENLYEIVVEKVVSHVFREIFCNNTPEVDFETWLRKFIHNYLKTISKNPLISRFMLWEIEAGGERVAQIAINVFGTIDPSANPLNKVIMKAIEDKSIRPVDSVQVIISLIALCVFPYVARPVLEKVIPELKIRSDEFLNRREEAIFDLIMNGLKPRHCGSEEATIQDVMPNAWLLW